MDTIEQHRRVAKTQLKWAGDATRDARYNSAQASRDHRQGNAILAAMHEQEAGLDEKFGNWRRQEADAAEIQANVRTSLKRLF